MAVRAEKAGAVLVTRPPVTEQPTPSTIRPAPDETAFVLPTGPAEPSLYDEVIEAGLRGVDDQETAKLLMLYHRSELDQLESAWRARGGSPTDALPFLPDRDNWTKKQRERRWISRTE